MNYRVEEVMPKRWYEGNTLFKPLSQGNIFSIKTAFLSQENCEKVYCEQYLPLYFFCYFNSSNNVSNAPGFLLKEMLVHDVQFLCDCPKLNLPKEERINRLYRILILPNFWQCLWESSFCFFSITVAECILCADMY